MMQFCYKFEQIWKQVLVFGYTRNCFIDSRDFLSISLHNFWFCWNAKPTLFLAFPCAKKKGGSDSTLLSSDVKILSEERQKTF